MAMLAPARAELALTNESVRLDTSALVSELCGILGTKLVAYIAGVSETRAVREWADASRAPRNEAEARLRFAFVVAKFISSEESARIAQTWMTGLNPQLGDRSAARLIREGDLHEVSPEILAAARSFVAS